MKERLTVSKLAFNIVHNSYASSYTKEEIKKINNTSEKEIYAKLGELEDIEEEFGIDLVTLFKAISCGAYHKLENDIIVFDNCSLMYKMIRIGSAVHWLSNYGKTWALTKEELE